MCVGFQALTVLEYLVAHGSERAIDEIREHSYQITVIFCSLILLGNGTCVSCFYDHL
jgi:hypothetical protein